MPVDTLSTRGYSDTESYNHRFNARLEWKISDNQNLMVRPSFSYQSNDPLSTTQGWQFGESGYSRTENRSDALRHGYNVRTNAVYRAKLGKDGRTITVDGDVNYSDNTNNSNSFSNVLPLWTSGPTASTRRGDGTRRATRACATCARTSRRRAATACADSSPTRNPSPSMRR